MVYLEYVTVEPAKARVTMQMFKPERLSTEQKLEGIEVADEVMPVPNHEQGVPQLFINPETLELWYEYEPHPEPMKSREEMLQDELEAMKASMAALMAEFQTLKGN